MKKLIHQIHLYLGLVSGLVVFIVSTTGCLYVFEEINPGFMLLRNIPQFLVFGNGLGVAVGFGAVAATAWQAQNHFFAFVEFG